MQKLITPASLPTENQCRPLIIPASRDWLGVFNALILAGIYPYNWEQIHETDLTPDECAAQVYAVYEQYITGECAPPATVPTPFWDEDIDVDDQEPIDTQTWYGEVSSFLAPIDNLSFTENAAIWAITGFVAYSAGIAPAIAFRTIARNFVLAIQREDVGEAIRIVVNGVQETYVDTTPYAAGEVFEVPISAETEAAYYDVTIIGGGTP